MKVGARVEHRMAHQLRPEERAVLKRVFRFTKKTRVMVSYSDQPDLGDDDTSFEFVHEHTCVYFESNGYGCDCAQAEFGHYGTVRVGRTRTRAVLRRFVARPLSLDDAMLYGEVDLSVLAVSADALLELGFAKTGSQIALAVFKAKKEAA